MTYFYIKTPTGQVLTTSHDNKPVVASLSELSCRWFSTGFVFHFLGDYLLNDRGDQLQFQVPDNCGPTFEEVEGDMPGPGDLKE